LSGVRARRVRSRVFSVPFSVVPLAIADVRLVRSAPIADRRGYFLVTRQASEFAARGLPSFVQENQALSRKRGTIRGLHFQGPPHAQAKLVRVLSGAILDVAVDLRAGSPSYGQSVAVELAARSGEALFVPRGFAHGYCTLADDTEVAYGCDAEYAPESEGGLFCFDPALAIAWPVAAADAIVSDKDRDLPRLADFVTPFAMEAA
jgi:dTDP-4-dehydrorhamnose 3,5-epimerase